MAEEKGRVPCLIELQAIEDRVWFYGGCFAGRPGQRVKKQGEGDKPADYALMLGSPGTVCG